MPEYLKTTEDKAPIVIHYIENYSADEVLTIMKKQDFDFQNFFNENPKSLASMLEHFSIDKECQAKVLHIWKTINYKFNPDDILYYMSEFDSSYNPYFYNNLFDYIVDNGTDINFKINEQTLIEKIFKDFITYDRMIGQSKLIKKKINEGKWDLSVSDSNGKDSIDYLKDLLKNTDESKLYTKRNYTSRYKTILLGEQSDNLMKNKESFINKISLLKKENKELISYIIPSLFFYSFKFLDEGDLNMNLEKGVFLKNLLSFTNEHGNAPDFERDHLLKLFESPVIKPENSYLFDDEKNFKDNVLMLCKLVRDETSEPSYAHFTYLYANKHNVKNIFLYSNLVFEVLNKMIEDRYTPDDNQKVVFYTIIDFFSYENIFKYEEINEEIKKFLKETNIYDKENMMREYLILEEKNKIEKIIKVDEHVVHKKRL